MIGQIFVFIVGLQHVAFGILEMFFWNTPLGRKIFRTEEGFAAKSKALAANQGLYNLFLASGLFFSFFLDELAAHWFRYFFLSCVVVAGIFGGATVNRKIFFLQAGPAIAGLFCLAIGA